MAEIHDFSNPTRQPAPVRQHGPTEHDRLWAALMRAERRRGLVLGLAEGVAILCFGLAVLVLVQLA